MKAVINEKETPAKDEYPKLMISTKSQTHPSRIVLFLDNKKGVLLQQPNDPHYDSSFVGEYCEWTIEAFTPFTGTITLSND